MRVRGAVLAVSLAACGGGGASGGDASAGGDGSLAVDAAPGAPVEGRIELYGQTWLQVEPPRRAPYVHAVFEGTTLRSWQTVTAREGACEVRELRLALCEGACDGYCLETGCVPFQPGRSVGTLTFSGLSTPFALEPQGDFFVSGQAYYTFEALPDDLVPEDAEVGASAPGADAPGFTVAATAPSELRAPALEAATVLELGGTGDVELAWTPGGGDGARVTLTVNTTNNGHGEPFRAILECVADDAAGQLVIPRAILDAFPEELDPTLACSGNDCPPSTLARTRTSRAAAGTGVVELVVGHRLAFGARLAR